MSIQVEKPSPIPVSHRTGTIGAVAATGNRHEWPIWHGALHILGVCIGALPRPRRFAAAVFLAPLTLPFIGATSMFRNRRRSVLETPREIALYAILNELARTGTEFEPQLLVEGLELIDGALKAGKGVLLFCARSMLGQSFVRHLAEQGYLVSVVSPESAVLFGGRVPVPTIVPGLKYFLAVRDRLRKGEIVIATPDRAQDARSVAVETEGGTVYFAPSLIEVALNAKAEVIFMRAWMNARALTVELVPSSLALEPHAGAIAKGYADFVRQHAERHRKSGPAESEEQDRPKKWRLFSPLF